MGTKTFEVGNATIVLSCEHDSFSDGHNTGYLEFYDERHRPAFPLTSETIVNHLSTIWNERNLSASWKAGRITGWVEALIENAEETFCSVPIEDYLTVLHPM